MKSSLGIPLPCKLGVLASQACDQEFSLNFQLLKRYIIRVFHPDAPIPSLADHKVAVIHVSCTYGLHPEVRKRGGKTIVKDLEGDLDPLGDNDAEDGDDDGAVSMPVDEAPAEFEREDDPEPGCPADIEPCRNLAKASISKACNPETEEFLAEVPHPADVLSPDALRELQVMEHEAAAKKSTPHGLDGAKSGDHSKEDFKDVEPIPENLQEEYNSLLMALLSEVPDVTPAGNRVRDEQRKLKAHKKQEAKDLKPKAKAKAACKNPKKSPDKKSVQKPAEKPAETKPAAKKSEPPKHKRAFSLAEKQAAQDEKKAERLKIAQDKADRMLQEVGAFKFLAGWTDIDIDEGDLPAVPPSAGKTKESDISADRIGLQVKALAEQSHLIGSKGCKAHLGSIQSLDWLSDPWMGLYNHWCCKPSIGFGSAHMPWVMQLKNKLTKQAGRHDADIDRGLGLYSLHDKLIAGDLVVPPLCSEWEEANLAELQEFLDIVEDEGSWSPPPDLPRDIAPHLGVQGPGKGLIMSLSKDQKARPGLITVDSRPTLQWSSDSIHKDARVPLYMDEFLQLDAQAFDLLFMDAECGPRLMSFGLRGLQDYLLNDFVSSSKPFDDLLAVDEAWKLGEFVMSCQETMLQALDAIEQQAAFHDTEFQKRQAAAEAAAEKILQGKPDRKDAVEKWLRGEIDRLVSKSRELKEKAGKAAEKAGCAVYKLLGLVQKHGCSDDFSEKLELWRQMDAAQKAAYQVVHAPKDGTLQEPQADHVVDAPSAPVVDAPSAPEDTLLDSTQVDAPPMASQPDAALKLPDEAETLLLNPNAYMDVNGDDQGGNQNDSQEAHTGEGSAQKDSEEAHTGEGGQQKDSKEAHTGEGVVQKDSKEAHTGEGVVQKEQQELEKLVTDDDDDSVEILNDDTMLEAELARMMLKAHT
ncbi:unnamed protein product [Symbiodinium sp. KB8]|nr:unnamed protein product [Symbiodinium sp. KB8]